MLLSYLIDQSRYLNIIGILIILISLYIFSENRTQINFKTVLNAFLMHFLIGFLALKTKIGLKIIYFISYHAAQIYKFADEGSGFLFGNLTNVNNFWGFIFAVKILPVIIFFGTLTSILFHFGIIQFFVKLANKIFNPIFSITGPETVCALSNGFLSQTEASSLIKNYLPNMSRSQIFLVMVSGMSTMSCAMIIIYSTIGIPMVHMLTCSFMSIPASILVAKIVCPETDLTNKNNHILDLSINKSNSIFESITNGTMDGLKSALEIGAILISFVSLIALLNYFIIYSIYKLNYILVFWFKIDYAIPEINLESILEYLLSPITLLFGFNSEETAQAGKILGTKIVFNEFLAYTKLIKANLSERSLNILTYALCGFSNFSSIGIQIGSIKTFAPKQINIVNNLGIKAVFVSAISNILSAMTAALLI